MYVTGLEELLTCFLSSSNIGGAMWYGACAGILAPTYNSILWSTLRVRGRVFGSSSSITYLFSSRTVSMISGKNSIALWSYSKHAMEARKVGSPFFMPFKICIVDKWACPSFFRTLTRVTMHDPSPSWPWVVGGRGRSLCCNVERTLSKGWYHICLKEQR